MTAKLVHYVQYHFPGISTGGVGTLLDQVKIVEIESREIKTLRKFDGSYGFQFFDIQSAVENGILMESRRLNVSPMHFYDAQIVQTTKAIGLWNPIFTEAVKKQKLTRVVLCNDDEFREFKHGDIVVMTKAKAKINK